MQDRYTETPTAISLVILDPEDILYDGRPLRVQALARALKDHLSSKSGSSSAVRQPDWLQLARQVERSIDTSMAVLLQEESLRYLLDRVEEIRRELIETEAITAYPDFLDVLRKIKEFGCEIAGYASGRRDTILTLMERLELDSLIGFCSCTQDAGRMIPAGAIPDILENLQFLPVETVMVSNNPILLNQAQAMEIPTISCLWGHPTPEAQSKATRTIGTPDRLYQMIKQSSLDPSD